MDTVTIYGDDTDRDVFVVVEGAIQRKFPLGDQATSALVTCSDGTALRITVDTDAVWRIACVGYGTGTTSIDVIDEHDYARGDYTDRATITADRITWVACGHDIATA